jgi:hypothetical protein
MNRFLIAGVLAVALGLGASNTAHAQIVYGYSVPVYGGVETMGTVYTPFGGQTFSNFYSPFTGSTYGQTYATNYGGATAIQNYGYNPFTGAAFTLGYARPSNVYTSPNRNPFYSITDPRTGITYHPRR